MAPDNSGATVRYKGIEFLWAIAQLDPVEFHPFKARFDVASFQAGMMPPILAFLLGLLVQIGLLDQSLKSGEGLLLIGILAAFLGTDNRLSGGNVDCPDARLYFVDMLASLTATPKGVVHHLLRIKDRGSGCFAEVNVQKPVFPPVAGTIRTSADP